MTLKSCEMLVSAIPEHLQCTRTLPASTPADFQPPFPAYCAQFPRNVADLVMATIGAQYASSTDVDGAATTTLSGFITSKSVEQDARPAFAEWASVTDNHGFYNVAVLAYWPSKAAYDKWAAASGFHDWWEKLDPKEQRHGWFLEVLLPTVDRFETVFSSNEVPEGAAHMREGVIGPIKEHVYWGSMRDRMAASQTDALVGEKVEHTSTNGMNGHASPRRVRVPGRQNLALIRSGQDWSATCPEERELYLTTMHPVLRKGMDFIRDHGAEVGCHNCRFMDLIDPATGKVDKDHTFGLAYFDDLGSLERWAREHPTHVAIFGGFLQYAKKLNNNVTLRLFHEVLVVKPEQQLFEYVSCHSGTGLLITV